jgi:ribosomal protein L33
MNITLKCQAVDASIYQNKNNLSLSFVINLDSVFCGFINYLTSKNYKFNVICFQENNYTQIDSTQRKNIKEFFLQKNIKYNLIRRDNFPNYYSDCSGNIDFRIDNRKDDQSGDRLVFIIDMVQGPRAGFGKEYLLVRNKNKFKIVKVISSFIH